MLNQPMIPRNLHAVVLLLVSVSTVAKPQTGNLPSAPAPAPSSKPSIFALPPATAHTAVSANEPTPPAPVEKLVCDAPATGLYAPQPSLSPQQQKAAAEYIQLVTLQVEGEWRRHMPRSANDGWYKGKAVKIRFAVLPDGSYDSAIVTVTSGHGDWDAHALAAVNSYASFPVPPETLKRPLIFCIEFKYDSDGSLHQSKPLDFWPPPAKPSQPEKPPQSPSAP
jgi:TonB family protein